MFRFVALAALLAVANAGNLLAPAAYASPLAYGAYGAYAAPAYAAHAAYAPAYAARCRRPQNAPLLHRHLPGSFVGRAVGHAWPRSCT
ncbi:Hypothetical predicted protein [Cloeon dipterum]|uniref:Uncharacterized protein n=1 Tax=Cloeon dipterum TaxID=197152 RepID=A0A8S1CZC4_9INSE|nr:Hypothetical predicted protein [Cloeon dipterum]